MAIRTDEATLKKLAHNAQPLLAAAGLQLGHKQCLELVARMHGHENFETAKAVLKRELESASERPPEAESVAAGSAEDMERRRRQAAIAARIGPQLQTSPETVIGDLCNAAIAALAKRFPPNLSEADRVAIKDNYPFATDDLIHERAMGHDGVLVVLATSEMLARISLDYCATSTFRGDMAKDEAVGPTVGAELSVTVEAAMARAVKKGLTPFGAVCTTVLVGTHVARSAGLHPTKIVRPLLDGIKMVLEEDARLSAAEAEDLAIKGLMQIGFSRSVAKKLSLQKSMSQRR